jgi:hypothetical protein
MSLEPRRKSKLAGGVYGAPSPPTARPESLPGEKPKPEPKREPAPDLRERRVSGDVPVLPPQDQPVGPVTRNPRRLRVVGKVSDEDLVSFNCKMSRGLRREVRHFAADAECDIQDVVAAALAEYLVARGRPVPASDLQQPG